VVAFVGSFLLSLLMGGSIVWYSRKRPAGAPLSWGEAMAAATYVFFISFWVYGVVPHQWLTYAQNELRWRSDALIIGPGSTGLFEWSPIAMSKQTAGDIIVVLIYGFYLAGMVALWAIWQGRGKRAEPAEVETSTYGRPLVKA
jgi:hypothetical protein